MPGFLFHASATAVCPHGGQVTTISANTRVLVGGLPVATASDQFMVAGCAFAVGPKPQPCLTVRWLVPATRVLVNGHRAVIQSGPGICQSAEQIPQGPPVVTATQTRVTGT
jgi:hypothetical protein